MNEERKNYTVYMHICPNGKKYIGVTNNTVQTRWNKGRGYIDQLFGNAIIKYGWINIQHIILAEHLTQKEAWSMEINLIKQWDTTNRKNGYNVSIGGNNYMKGVLISNKEKQKRSIRFGKPVYQFDSKGNYIKRWKNQSEAENELKICGISHTCLKKQNCAGGYYWTFTNDSIYGKMPIGSLALKKYIQHHIYLGKRLDIGNIPVKQWNFDGTFIKEWKSATRAGEALNIVPTRINAVCRPRNGRKSAGGFLWSYANLEEQQPLKYFKGARSVQQFSLNNVFLKEWETIKDASCELNIDSSSITKACKGKAKTAKGYIWKYTQNKETNNE